MDKTDMQDKYRVVVIDPERCKPSKCAQECLKNCEGNTYYRFSGVCLEVTSASTICFV